MHADTSLIHLGRASGTAANVINPPLVRASTMVFGSLAEFKKSYAGVAFESARYGRFGTSTAFELQSAMAKISHAESCIATASGLSAIAAVLGAHAGVGKQILVYEGVYGPARALCEKMRITVGTRITFFHDADAMTALIDDETSLILIETPSSLTMRMPDVQAICTVARAHAIPVACDSTWGTPIYFNAHALGIDISIHAATKFINGHSDVMLGLITGSYRSLSPVREWCERHGSHTAPDSCWLALRGLRTLAIRMQRHQASAITVAQWLLTQARVKNVTFPVLPSDPGHVLWKTQFSGGGGPFVFELESCSETAFACFIDGLKLFGLGTSWGGFESLAMPAIPHHLRLLEVLPDEGRLVRLHIGLEDAGDLCADLAQALAKI